MAKKLFIKTNGKTLKELHLGQTLNIGRAPENDIELDSPQVSRSHAAISFSADGVTIKDLNSTHGVFVGGKKVNSTIILKTTDVSLGNQVLTFEIQDRSEEITNPKFSPHNPSSSDYAAPLDQDVGFFSALNLVLKTSPYVLARLGIYFLITVLTIIWYVVFFGLLSFLGKDNAMGVWVGLIIIAMPLGIAQLFFKYSLYLLKAGHIAVLTELIHGKGVPQQGMVQYGKDAVVSNFGQINILFIVDAMIKGVVSTINSALSWLTSWLPIPGLNSVVGLVQTIIQMATTYIDESIFSYNLTQQNKNVWQTSCDGLVLYAQNSKEILTVAIWAVVFDWITTGVLYVLMLIPSGMLIYASPKLGAVTFVVALFLAFNIRAALVRPIMLTYILLNFHKIRQGQTPSVEWQHKLHDMSDKFREMEEQARSFVNGKIESKHRAGA